MRKEEVIIKENKHYKQEKNILDTHRHVVSSIVKDEKKFKKMTRSEEANEVNL